ncbi:DUF6344 domain-containing protein [Streptomyces apricus]|uniref:DUF6344 domain-containing protein n=1 Tax=Streptomyces apricus TaxID=1828112 RepID=UPI001CAA8753|nr:DUF6344 domain-containing protein [Streptomyces apricus]
MSRNRVMNLWTALVSAFLTLCTSLGLITTTAVAAVPEASTARNINTPQKTTAQEEPVRARPRADSLPPTMKQRIHAEAHGSSPSCRHRPPTDTTTTDTASVPLTTATARHENAPAPAVPAAPATAMTTDGIDRTEAVPTPAGAQDLSAALSLPVPSDTTHRTTGAMIDDTPAAAPAAQISPGTDAAPAAACFFPTQSSPTAQLPAPAPAPVSDPARTLVGAGTAHRA